jgi:putative ABC transport system ATP-binding protein
MIQLNNISKQVSSGSQKTMILQNINLHIEEGEFVSIMGPSGSGKSTLLHILGLLESPTEGKYYLQGQEVQSISEKQKNEIHRNVIGFVFQAYHLIDELTVFENIETPLMYKDMSKSNRQSKVAELLDKFQMVAKKDLYPAQLSGGQQQLVGIARALAIEPKLILADEPTGNLHSDQAKHIMSLFKHLNENEGVTIVQVTHSDYNATFSNKVIQIKDGKIIQ